MGNIKEKETVVVGVANSSERRFKLVEVYEWEPKNISRMGDITYFKVEETFYSMPTSTFSEIFNK